MAGLLWRPKRATQRQAVENANRARGGLAKIERLLKLPKDVGKEDE